MERAEERLQRERYWRGEAEPPGPLRELRARVEALADALHADLARPLPDDPALHRGPRWRRSAKRLVTKLIRPATRRHDRAAAELAAISLELLDHLGRLEDELRRLRESVASEDPA